MKKITAVLLALFCAFGTAGCDRKSMNYIIENKPSFTGIVAEVREDTMVVVCDTLAGYSAGTRCAVTLSPQNGDSYTTPAVGDAVTVYYDGSFMETDPLQLGEVFAITLQTPAEQRIAPKDGVLTAPPALTLLAQEQKVQAQLGTYSWTYGNSDGSSTGINADSAHVTAMEDLPVLTLKHSPLSHSNPFHVLLDFEVLPDELRLFAWAEDGTALGELETAVLCVDAAEGSAPAGGMYGTAEFLDEAAVYEVQAKWHGGEEDGSPWGGEAFYGFSVKVFPTEE